VDLLGKDKTAEDLFSLMSAEVILFGMRGFGLFTT